MHFPIIKPPPSLTRSQMVEVDRLMVENYQIALLQMMENAGRCLAILARERFLAGNPEAKSVLVLAGPGGNGGGAMVAARRLANWGASVCLVLSHAEERLTPVPSLQHKILNEMGVLAVPASDLNARSFDLILDGLIGYSLLGAPRGLSAQLIDQANASPASVLALDVPSGYDVETGSVFSPAIKAAATLTLALPKKGMLDMGNMPHIGELFCADISVPPALYAAPSLQLPPQHIFNTSEIVRLDQGAQVAENKR